MPKNPMQKPIVLFMPSFRGGGAERVMVTLANALGERGHVVCLAVASGTGAYREEVSAGVEVVDFGCPRVSLAVRPLARLLRERDPAAMLVTMTNANVVAVLACLLARCPTRLVLREPNVLSGSPSWRKRLLHAVAAPLYRRADAIVAVSGGVRDELRARFALPKRLPVEVIHNPAATAVLIAGMQAPLAAPLPGEPSEPLVLAVGRLHPSKGFATLIEAIARLEGAPRARLAILGEGEQRPELERRVVELGCAGRVFLPGFVANPFAWMARCDAFVLSSRHEGSPNVLLQALACGAEVIATRLPGCTDELLEGGGLGRLVPIDDSRAMARAIDDALEHPRRPDIARWRERHSVEAVAESYERLLLAGPASATTGRRKRAP